MGKRSRETAEQERTPKKRKKPKKLEPQDGEELGLPVVEELDEISLQLREEKRKALKILDSMVTDGNEGGETEEVVRPPEKVYNVNTDLRQLFGNSAGGGFSFLGSSADEGSVEDVVDHNASPEDPEKSRVKSNQATDSEASANIGDIQDTPKYFFFHSGSNTLRNRIDENSFYRTQTWEELEREWPTKRTAMKQSFRRRHKDALKFGKRKKGG